MQGSQPGAILTEYKTGAGLAAKNLRLILDRAARTFRENSE